MLIKLIFILAFLPLSINAAVIDLSGGEARYFGEDLVRCDSKQQDPWRVVHTNCSCIINNILELRLEFANREVRIKSITRTGSFESCFEALSKHPSCQ